MNKRRLITTFTVFLIVSMAKAQTSYKFDFGSGKTAPGYTQITPETKFNYQAGYGFDQKSVIESIDRGGNALTGDFITGQKPFYFSVKVPDGNYDVKVLLGDTKGTSATTVRVENRRLMLENIRTQFGKIITQTFTVHVRDSLIRDSNGDVIDKIRLKPREVSYLHWDNMLTIEFNDSLPKVCAVEVTPEKQQRLYFLRAILQSLTRIVSPGPHGDKCFRDFLFHQKLLSPIMPNRVKH